MSETHAAETHVFQAEVQQILHLMIHSLYSNKEIFLRELVSNAADASDKLRFAALKDPGLLGDDTELHVTVSCDPEARTVTIEDNGIGMNRDEVIANIGTIARSGTREFLDSLTGDEAADSRLIGQFGVGFYSAFVVADNVVLETRKAGSDDCVRWESAGSGEYALSDADERPRGTRITLHLREGEDEFTEAFRLRGIIKKYSDHLSVPVRMLAAAKDEDSGDDAEAFETVNKGSAFWTRPKQELDEEAYAEFYQHTTHDYEAPLAWTHNRVEGKTEYTSLLYIPARQPFELWDPNAKRGVKLFVQRVFIMDDAEQLLPRYLRFVRGVVDSNDLPLNVSRELLQSNRVVDTIRAGNAKKVLARLVSLADKEPEQYAKFWAQFGTVLKEGPGEDQANRETLAKLLRFNSTTQGDALTSLSDYVERMKTGQEKIFYITADSLAAAQNSPQLEAFEEHGVEVLLLHDRIDEWLVSSLPDFDDKPLQSASSGDLELGELLTNTDTEKHSELEESSKDLVERIKAVLGDKVSDVRVSKRLRESPACVVTASGALSGNLERMLRAAGQEVPASTPVLEVNPGHALLVKMQFEEDTKRFGDWTELLLDQAVLSEGGQLENPAAFVKRMNAFLVT